MWLFYTLQKDLFPFWCLQYIQQTAVSLCHRHNLTSVSNHGNVCEAAPRFLSWAPNGLSELPEVRLEFLFSLIGQSTMAFLTGPGGGQVQGFWCCLADGLNQSSRVLVSSVVQADCCLRSGFWFSCTLVPCDCFCGAEMLACPPRRISLSPTWLAW